ncbi:MAG: serine/threonine-protein kinase, partial [Gemmatimonadaceae bacterium]
MAAHDQPTLQYRPAVAKSGSVGGTLLTQSKIMQALREATLGDYEILAEIGRGGMATVYLAHDISLDRKVAIKVMSPALLDGEGAIERFKREAKTAGALSHPHIIPIHAVRQSGDLLYFVMKFVEGRTLDDVLRAQGGLAIPMVVQILTEVAGALAYAHRKGVVHRDVKPANIMLDDDGWAVVTDFGIAKVVEKKGLTLTGSTVGTPAYMSPEQCAAKDVTGKSDQYSLGIVGYELLTGKVPFEADSLMGMFMAQLNDVPTPLAEVRPDCPRLLAQTIERLMAKTPEERWPTLDD